MQKRASEALTHLGASEQKLTQAYTEAAKIPEFARRIQAAETKLAQSYDTKGGVFKESKEDIKYFLLEKMRMEAGLHLSLIQTPMTPQKQQEIKMIESTKIHDSIYLQFGVKAHYLSAAAEHYKL